MKNHICPKCHKLFSGRANRKFCSTECKNNYNNERINERYHLKRDWQRKAVNLTALLKQRDAEITELKERVQTLESALMVENIKKQAFGQKPLNLTKR